jgi:transcriptional regulator with XRE-family HTH domain
LARKAVVTDASVIYWERGEFRHIKHENLLILTDVFDITVSELVGDPRLVRERARSGAKALAEFADWLPSDYENPDFQADVDQARRHALSMADDLLPPKRDSS